MGAISGVCRHPTTGVPGAYRVFASDYYTAQPYGQADSDPVTGEYSIPVPDNARVRVVRVNAPLVEDGSSIVLGLPMDGTGGTFEEIAGGHDVVPWNVLQIADATAPGGRCAVFDANNKSIDIGWSSRLIFPGAFTVGVWLQFISLTNATVFDWSEGAGSIICDTAGNVSYAGDYIAGGLIATVGTGVWRHFAVTRDDDGIVRKFFDGEMTASGESYGGLVGFSSDMGNLGIGRNPVDEHATLRAKMAGFFFADRALWTDDFTPPEDIPAAAIYTLGEPFAASEVADYIETIAF